MFFHDKTPEGIVLLVARGLRLKGDELEQYCIDNDIELDEFVACRDRVLQSVANRPYFDAILKPKIPLLVDDLTKKDRLLKLTSYQPRIDDFYLVDCQLHRTGMEISTHIEPLLDGTEIGVDLGECAHARVCILDTGSTVTLMSSKLAEQIGVIESHKAEDLFETVGERKHSAVYGIKSSTATEAKYVRGAVARFCIANGSLRRAFDLQVGVFPSEEPLVLFGLGDIQAFFRFEYLQLKGRRIIRSWLTDKAVAKTAPIKITGD